MTQIVQQNQKNSKVHNRHPNTSRYMTCPDCGADVLKKDLVFLSNINTELNHGVCSACYERSVRNIPDNRIVRETPRTRNKMRLVNIRATVSQRR